MKGQVSLVVLGMLLAPAAFAQAPESAIGTPASQHPDLSPQDDPAFNRGINAQELAPRALPAPGATSGSKATDATTTRDMAHDAPMDRHGQSGSTGPAASGVLAHVDKGSIAKEPRQTTRELTATTLLNRFSQLGFAGVRAFRRDGDHYAAQAQTMNGNWVNVTIDPISGDVRANGPVG